MTVLYFSDTDQTGKVETTLQHNFGPFVVKILKNFIITVVWHFIHVLCAKISKELSDIGQNYNLFSRQKGKYLSRN